MISTSNYSSLPDKLHLQKICKAISVLDAILSPEWEYRYYSYQSKWSDNEEFCEMRNGQGDHMLILFRKEGCVINGMTHEYYPRDKSKLTKGLPEFYNEFIFGEPVNSIGTTFCLWTVENSKWKIGELENFDDGSGEMLEIFDSNPQTYISWATDYYEGGFKVSEHTFEVVSNIYRENVLTKKMVLSLINNLEDWDKLKEDLKEINFPFQFE